MNTNLAVDLSRTDGLTFFDVISSMYSRSPRTASELASSLNGVPIDTQVEQVFFAKQRMIFTATRFDGFLISGIDPLRSFERQATAYRENDDLILELEVGKDGNCYYKVAVWMFENGPNLTQKKVEFNCFGGKAIARIEKGCVFPTLACLMGPEEISDSDLTVVEA